jgi:hypothetical protein
MAICGRCGGQTESAGEDCPRCREYVPATSRVFAYSGAASRATYGAAGGYGSIWSDRYAPGDHHGELQIEQVERALAGLPACERPFATEGTVWPGAAELVPTPTEPGAADDDAGVDAADGRADLLPAPSLPPSGRWIALTAAILVLLAAVAGAATLVVQHGRASQRGRDNRPGVTARPLASVPPGIAPAGENQLTIEPGAAAAPNEVAVVAFLNRYFDAVSQHEFGVYKRLFILRLRRGLTPASVSAGLGTTTDSGVQLRSISRAGSGEVAASVTYVSRQTAGGRPTDSTCTTWSIQFSLGWRGGRYLLVSPPLWYPASASSCS